MKRPAISGCLPGDVSLPPSLQGFAMVNSIFKKTLWYLDYYCTFVADWWGHIGFWEYIVVMILCLFAGYLMLKGPARGRC
jgi:hypothetical protein